MLRSIARATEGSSDAGIRSRGPIGVMLRRHTRAPVIV